MTYNGEIYNYLELREELGREHVQDDLRHRGDPRGLSPLGSRLRRSLPWHVCVCALGRSEAGAVLRAGSVRHQAISLRAVSMASSISRPKPKPCCRSCPRSTTDHEALKEYLAFQFCLAGRTLFKGISAASARAHADGRRTGRSRSASTGRCTTTSTTTHRRNTSKNSSAQDSRTPSRLHLRSDVPLGAYVSGGLDSGIVASMASRTAGTEISWDSPGGSTTARSTTKARTRKRSRRSAAFDARDHRPSTPRISSTTSARSFFTSTTRRRAPVRFRSTWCRGSSSRHRKVVLGGQGGDEIFGGYTRYLIAYFEQCIKAAIDGTMHNGNFVVTYESIIPNLVCAAAVQATSAGVLARRAVRADGSAIFPADQSCADAGRRNQLGTARRLLAASRHSGRSSTARTCGRSRTSTS